MKTVVCQDRLGTNIREDPQRRGQFSFSGLPENTTAFLPFEDMQDRLVPVVNGVLKDMIAPHGVNVYRTGCDVPCTGKRHFLCHLYIKCIILPRQARDDHRENSKKVPFSLRAAAAKLQTMAHDGFIARGCAKRSSFLPPHFPPPIKLR